jgi:hypothetical protein
MKFECSREDSLQDLLDTGVRARQDPVYQVSPEPDLDQAVVVT